MEGWAPSDTATATTAGATAGPGETLNSLQGRTGNEHRFVCSRNERSPSLPSPRGAPVYLAARFHRYRAGRERGGSTGAASLVTRPGNVTRSFIRSTPLACTRPIIRAITSIDRFAQGVSLAKLSPRLTVPVYRSKIVVTILVRHLL